MIHQMMTLEQYLNVANMWIVENDGGNIYDQFDESMFDNQSLNMSQSSMPNIDYKTNLKRMNTEEDEEVHGERVKKEFMKNNATVLDLTKDLDVPTDEAGPTNNARGFKSLATKVTRLGVKIKELFYKKSDAQEALYQGNSNAKTTFDRRK